MCWLRQGGSCRNHRDRVATRLTSEVGRTDGKDNFVVEEDAKMKVKPWRLASRIGMTLTQRPSKSQRTRTSPDVAATTLGERAAAAKR